jgi:hypothetical protein
MPAPLRNFEFRYSNAKGKPVFVPTPALIDIHVQLRKITSDLILFPDYYFHFRKGGHVSAIHSHRNHKFFARIDLKNFFYSIGRNRLKNVLKSAGVHSAEHFARWSTVKNPCEGPRYSIPYGFPHSPWLATLVLHESALGRAIEELRRLVHITVYLDDIALSSNDIDEIQLAYKRLLSAVEASGFQLNKEKSRNPVPRIEIFNCELAYEESAVTPARISEFYAIERSENSVAAFKAYCASIVSAGT